LLKGKINYKILFKKINILRFGYPHHNSLLARRVFNRKKDNLRNLSYNDFNDVYELVLIKNFKGLKINYIQVNVFSIFIVIINIIPNHSLT